MEGIVLDKGKIGAAAPQATYCLHRSAMTYLFRLPNGCMCAELLILAELIASDLSVSGFVPWSCHVVTSKLHH
jgi:hypothetical protein